MREMLSRMDGWSRRRFLERAARVSLGVGVCAGLDGALAAEASKAGGKAGKAKRLIYLYMAGGMTHLDTFDVKPGSENQGQTGAINTSVPGIQISEYLPTIASQFGKVAVIRSMNTETADHEQGEYLMRTSYEQIATERHPSIGPWIQRLKGRQNKNLPDTVTIGAGARHPGAGFLDPTYSPLPIGDPNKGLENTQAPSYLTDESFEKRITLINSFDRKFREKYPVKSVKSYTDFYDEATTLLTSGELQAFDLGKEKPADRDKYGRDPFGQGCMLARRLIENNVRCVEVTLGGWDMHNTMWDYNTLPKRAATLDQAVGTLLADLSSRGLLDDTIVVLATEFGRSPTINYNAGRDHHPAAFSAMLAGAGIKGGQAYGKSDKRGHGVEEDGVTPADLNATVAEALGLPRDEVVMSPTLRPFKVAHDGSPVRKLLS
ncbi:MAG: DUF1501 domain-containing protein [Planctomycetia bacterium]|nr:DUF1501 domain-containing protein [Planctomycetia bacterium]